MKKLFCISCKEELKVGKKFALDLNDVDGYVCESCLNLDPIDENGLICIDCGKEIEIGNRMLTTDTGTDFFCDHCGFEKLPLMDEETIEKYGVEVEDAD